VFSSIADGVDMGIVNPAGRDFRGALSMAA
jgi:hypothetical protein